MLEPALRLVEAECAEVALRFVLGFVFEAYYFVMLARGQGGWESRVAFCSSDLEGTAGIDPARSSVSQ